jgi:thiol-disulfide isomerase/thioredoxin
MTSFVFSITFFLAAGFINTSESQTYYKFQSSNKIYTKSDFETFKSKNNIKIKKKYGPNAEIKYIPVDSIVSNDSIIKTFKHSIKVSSINRPKEKIYDYINKKLPEATFKTINGEPITLSDLKGKPIMINLWFTRCKPCVKEIPILNKLAEKYKNEIHFISITFDNKTTILDFFKTQDFNFTTIIGAREYLNTLGVSSYPKNIFIAKNGNVKTIKRGIRSYIRNGKREMGTGEEFERILKSLL